MKSLVDLAVENNMIWCGIVCNTHGISQTSKENVWGLLSKAPMFYPDIITLDKSITVREINDFIESREIVGIKDSYANLDMVTLGFKILFEAEWIYYAPVIDIEVILTLWREISTEEDLLRWNSAKGTESVIKSELLQRNDVKIFIHEDEGDISGFIANLGANVIGISNVFSTCNENKSLWTDIVKIASTKFPGLPIVGYEQNDDLKAAHLSGWTSIGPLRVWIKENLLQVEFG